jgi:hypothetical protein
MSQFKIIVGGDVFCPCCGTAEVEDTSLPVMQWKWNIRPNKVESGGVWWSECLLCHIWFGSDGHFDVTDKTDPAMRERLGLTQNGRYLATYEGEE